MCSVLYRAKNSTGRAGTIRLDQRKPAGLARPVGTVDRAEKDEIQVASPVVASVANASGGKGSKRRRCASAHQLVGLDTNACCRFNLATFQSVDVGKKPRPLQQLKVVATDHCVWHHVVRHATRSSSLVLMIRRPMASAKRAFAFGATPIRTIIGPP